ncbi:hypothetical protein R3P38DRAFT_165882 [Favolaschia claudopus]|uniref:F-box domain-containing protein n=1 Tax=Favolaschia claudopus TaxID=2862362 RepID=A0AAW0CYR4_9AGAR
MHRCLQVVEIVSLVCEEIEERSLPSFARVCRAFNDPALDVLWSHQNSLGNILRCMPEGIWEEVFDEDDDEVTWVMNRPVLPSDWERPLVYAHRVKSLNYDGRFPVSGRPTSAEFLQSLHLCLPRQHLFPNLQTLWFFSRYEWTFEYIRLFLGPQINDLFLARPQTAAHLSLLPTIAAECPLLKDLEIQHTNQELDCKDAVSALVLGLHRLESIILPCLDNVALEHLARLPGLKSLTLENQTVMSAFPAGFSNDILFPSLESLHIMGEDVDAILPLLTLMTQAPLRDLDIDVAGKITANRLAALYSAIIRYCKKSHTSLERFHYCPGIGTGSAIPTDADISTYLVPGSHILSLAPFTNLSVVLLTAPLGFDLDDAIVADLAQTWPHICELSIYSTFYVNRRSRITLKGLLSFAQHCPHLRSLALPLDATSSSPWPHQLVSEADANAGRRIQQNSLLYMIVMRSPIADPLLVAGFLSSVFPKLNSILTDKNLHGPQADGEGDDVIEAIACNEKWKAVAAALPMLRSIRKEERTWTRRRG